MDYKKANFDTLEYYKRKASTFRNSQSVFWHHEVNDLLSYLPQGSLIEIGCGVGAEAGLLGEHFDYLGIDITPEFVDIAAKNNPNLKFVCSNISDLPKIGKIFDGFWCAATLLHIPRSEVVDELKAIASVLHTGSIGFISVKEGVDEVILTLEGEEGLPPRLFCYWNRNDFSVVLRKAGFEVIDVIQKQSASRANPEVIDKWLGFFVCFDGIT